MGKPYGQRPAESLDKLQKTKKTHTDRDRLGKRRATYSLRASMFLHDLPCGALNTHMRKHTSLMNAAMMCVCKITPEEVCNSRGRREQTCVHLKTRNFHSSVQQFMLPSQLANVQPDKFLLDKNYHHGLFMAKW